MKKQALILILLLCLSVGFSKSYYYNSENIQLNVLDNGLVQVTEELTYVFDDCFIAAIGSVPLASNEELSNFESSSTVGNLIETTHYEGNEFVYDLEFPTYQCNKEVTVTIEYELNGVVDVYDDASSLHYMLWSNANERVNNFSAQINVYGDVIDYWIHNDVLFSSYSSQNEIITYSSTIPSNHWIEIQVLFPKLTNTTYAAIQSGNIIEKQKAIENGYILFSVFSYIVAIIFFISPLLLFYLIYNKYGREEIVNYIGSYEHNAPTNHTPSMVSAILNSPNNGEPDMAAFTATIFDLARRKYLKIKGTEKDVVILILDKDSSKLEEQESKILEFLIKNSEKSEINWKKLKRKLSGNYSSSRKFYNIFNIWKNKVTNSFNKNDFFNSKGNNEFLKYSLLMIISFSVLGVFLNSNLLIILISSLSFAPFVIIPLIVLFGLSKTKNVNTSFIVSGIIVVAITYLVGLTFNDLMITAYVFSVASLICLNIVSKVVLGKWTRKGRNFELKWNNFKKYLKDYSLLKDHPPQSITIWEQFLVYAIALGVADNVINIMKLKIPSNQMKRSNFGVFYYYPYFYSSMTRGFSTGISRATTSRSSGGSRGFGGGFGGFGGGSGGGFRGAR